MSTNFFLQAILLCEGNLQGVRTPPPPPPPHTHTHTHPFVCWLCGPAVLTFLLDCESKLIYLVIKAGRCLTGSRLDTVRHLTSVLYINRIILILIRSPSGFRKRPSILQRHSVPQTNVRKAFRISASILKVHDV